MANEKKIIDKKEAELREQPSTHFIKSQDYRSIYANHAAFEVSVFDVQVTFGESSRAGDKAISVDQKVRVVMSPQHAKVFAHALLANIESYEQQIAEISLPQDAS